VSRDDAFEELKTLFAEDLAGKVRALQDAVTASDWEAISKISHQIGGTAKSFGYPEVSSLAHELERTAREISLGDAAALVKKISDALVL